MQSDLYTKCVLTIIAASLVVIAFRAAPTDVAFAQTDRPCGAKLNPCYISTWQGGIEVRLER